MRVKGYLVGDWNVFKQGTEVTIDMLPVYEEQMKFDALKRMLDATIEDVVCKEYLEHFKNVPEWHEYIDRLLNNPEGLIKGFIYGAIRDEIESKAEEIWEESKPRYYPVEVNISLTHTFWVKAKSEEDVEYAIDQIMDVADIMEKCDPSDCYIEHYSIGDVESDISMFSTVYDTEENMFI